MKELESIETEEYALCVFECLCGFHIGFDTTYLEQVGDIKTRCPSCDTTMLVEGWYKEDEEPDYVKFNNIYKFGDWCREGGWTGATGFELATGVSFDKIKGLEFQVINNRVFLKE